MAVVTACGNLNITTGALASTVAVSSLGFTPKVILFWWSGATGATNGERATSLRGIGAAVSASSFFAQANYDEDAAASQVGKNNVSTTGCVIELDNTGAVVGRADLQSFDADGFTLEIQDVFVTDLLVSWYAIGGDDIDIAELGSLATPGATGEQTTNNTGNFRPDITFFFIGAQMSTGADAVSMLGAASGASNQGVLWGGSNDGATTMAAGSYCLSGECVANHQTAPSTAASPTGRARFVSHNASPGGFTVNWVERNASSPNIQWLSIKGGLWAVGNLLTLTDAVTPIAETGLGFTPVGALFASAGNAETVADAVHLAHCKWSLGAASGASSRVVQQIDSRNGQADAYVHRAARADAVYINTDPNQVAHTTTGLMDLTSFDADGLTCIMDDADPGAAFVFYVAVGSEPPPEPEPESTAARIQRISRSDRIWRP
jgi:hypothetical protein